MAKSKQDVKTMLKRSGAIDLEYLTTQMIKLGVEDTFKELREELEADEME